MLLSSALAVAGARFHRAAPVLRPCVRTSARKGFGAEKGGATDSAANDTTEGPSGTGARDSGDSVAFEEAMNRRRKARVKVQAPVVEQVYGNQPKTPQSQAEETFVSTLGILGTVILLMGVYLAASGFLPESLDQFGQNVVYPIFSPTVLEMPRTCIPRRLQGTMPAVVVFLAMSTGYGLWKSKQT